MPIWIETTWHYCIFGLDVKHEESKSRRFNDGVWENFIIAPDLEALRTRVTELCENLSEDQFEIKAVLPLQRGRANTYAQWSIGNASGAGIGHGYGWTANHGFLVLAQRKIEISEEEYKARVERPRLRRQFAALEEQAKQARQRAMEATADEAAYDGIVEKKGMFGGVSYLVGSKKMIFESLDKATQFVASKKSDAAEARRLADDAEAQLARVREALAKS
jgi:hypothetical protein